MNIDSTLLKQLVISIAQQQLLPRFTRVSSEEKADGSLITEADLAMQQQLQQALQQHWPEISLLSEEMSAAQQQQALTGGTAVWCLDPLDGTTNFATGIPYFAVSLSLIVNAEVVLGLVYDPLRDECFFAENGQPATLNEQPLQTSTRIQKLKQAVAIIDFKRLAPALASHLVQQQPFASQRNFGASALDWCWLAAGRSHLYLHGRQNIWDYSAGSLIFRQAGGKACTLEGETVFTEQLSGRSVVAAENAMLLEQWYNWLTKHKT